MFSSFNQLTLCGTLLYLITSTSAATVTYDFSVGWVTANPDGAFERRVMGINGQWPIPHITADVGDHVIVNVMNQLGDQPTGIHFHGLYQNGTANMDGPVGVTQCPIAPGMSFKYEFDVSPLLLTRDQQKLIFFRSKNQEHIGIIRIHPANILMDFVEH